MPIETSKAAARLRSLAVIMLILLPISALGSRFEFWPHKIGLLLFAISMVGSLIIQIIAALWLLRKPSTGTKTTLRWACVFALPPLVLIAALLRGDAGPRAGIHNISTDTSNPPEFFKAAEARGDHSNPLVYGEEIAKIQQQAYPGVKPIFSELDTAQAFEKALITAKDLGWTIYHQDNNKGIIEAFQTTFWFGFKDDIVIRITALQTGSRIDLRSVSRIGRDDLGANAERILHFSKDFKSKTGQ